MRSLLRVSQNVLRASERAFSGMANPDRKVAILGAAGGIGQPLSLLMKMNPNVSDLALYDIQGTPGVAADISHINSKAITKGYAGAEQLGEALKGSDVIIIPAGVPRKPGMTRDDLFNVNAGIVANIADVTAAVAPSAVVCIISNPVNSTVPIFAEVMKKKGVYNKSKIIGVTTLDVVRANTFVAENQKFDVSKTNVTVVGGHAGITILPLLSQVPGAKFSQADKEALTHRIMFGGDEVVKAKGGSGSATLSMAYAGARFVNSVLRGFKGEKGVVECAYVESDVAPVSFFSSPVELGPGGVAKINGIGKLDAFEQKKYEEALPELKASIQKGVEFAKNRK